MSILIKGMEMPKDGCHHMICIYADGTVSTGGRVYTAVPVPPHGRLIDAARLKRQVEGRLWKARDKFVELIDNAPTIIEADYEGEEA